MEASIDNFGEIAHGVKGQESDIYMIQNLKYKQQDIIRIIFR